MDVETVKLDRTKARELYRAYRDHLHYSDDLDHEIRRTYQLIAQGRVVIQALASIKAAGLDEEGLPKLAIARATDKKCLLDLYPNGAARFANARYARGARSTTSLPADTFPRRDGNGLYDRQAIIPVVPVHLRPKKALHRYHILWEADWHQVPRDPYLLRRIGKGDLWLVVAAWDLTEVERAALATRVNG